MILIKKTKIVNESVHWFLLIMKQGQLSFFNMPFSGKGMDYSIISGKRI